MGIAVALIFIGITLVLIGILGILSFYLCIVFNVARKNSTWNFLSVMLCMVISVSGFIWGFALIDLGVKKMDSFEEGKK